MRSESPTLEEIPIPMELLILEKELEMDMQQNGQESLEKAIDSLHKSRIGPRSAAAGDIFRAMPAIMKVVGPVAKESRNQQQGYNFRGIDDVYAAVQLAMANEGVFPVPRVLSTEWSERQTKSGGVMFHLRALIRHTFYACDGSSVEADTLGEAMDSGDKASNKAMSAAMKYALIEVFCIPTREPKDTENDSPEVVPVSPKAPAPRQSASKMLHVTPPSSQSAPSVAPLASPVTPAKPARAKITNAQRNKLFATLKTHMPLPDGLSSAEERERRISYLQWATGREDLQSSTDVYQDELDALLAKIESGEVPQ